MTDAAWYAARGTGLVALVMLTVSVVLGIVVRSGRRPLGLHRFGITEVHRTASMTACALIAVHLVSLLLDPYAQIRLLDTVVPFVAAYRPVWVGLGTVALDLLVAVIVTAVWRHRLGTRVFRTLHWATYLLWPVAFLHGIGSGSDRSTGWYLVTVVACALAVLCVLGWRTSETFAVAPSRRSVSRPAPPRPRAS